MFSVPIDNYILDSAQNTIKAVTIISNGFYRILCIIYGTVHRNPSNGKKLSFSWYKD